MKRAKQKRARNGLFDFVFEKSGAIKRKKKPGGGASVVKKIAAAAPVDSETVNDVASALENLGTKKATAREAARRAAASHPGASFESVFKSAMALARVSNPKKKKPARRNPNAGEVEAKKMFKSFHQKASTGHKDFKVPVSKPAHLAKLGALIELHVKALNGDHFILKPKGVTLACTGDGAQMYFLGGDQVPPLQQMGVSGNKDHVKLGHLTKIVYLTEKGFHDFNPTEYIHRMGEEGGVKPDLDYDTKSKLLYLVGGSYLVKRAGIVH